MTARHADQGTSKGAVTVFDFSGHPFQVDLSRSLARDGYDVTHSYCPSYVSGKGALEKVPGDPERLTITPLPMGDEFNRYSPLRRLTQEIKFGITAALKIRKQRPDVVLLSNIPLFAEVLTAAILRASRITTILWHQDIQSLAISSAARERLPVVGPVVGYLTEGLERFIARTAASVVVISDAFVPELERWGVRRDRIHVISNWAPIDQLPVTPKANAWALEHGLEDRPVVMYAGTLGLKHDPQALAEISTALETADPSARVVVISEGLGRDWLEKWRSQVGSTNLILLDFQPFEALPNVLGTSDVLIAILEPDASAYSVPSKVLTYLCTGRPIVAIVPDTNAISQVLTSTNAGYVVEPHDYATAQEVVVSLIGDQATRSSMAAAGRRFAEENFPSAVVAAKFEAVIDAAIGR